MAGLPKEMKMPVPPSKMGNFDKLFLVLHPINYICWLATFQIFPEYQAFFSFGFGAMVIHAMLWCWKGHMAVRHDVWCRNDKEITVKVNIEGIEEMSKEIHKRIHGHSHDDMILPRGKRAD